MPVTASDTSTLLPATSGAAAVELSKTASVSSMVASNSYASVVLADGAAAYYQLNDATAVLVDSGPNRITGTYGTGIGHGASPLTTGGVSAANFAGGNSYNAAMFASIPVNANLMPQTMTVEAWIKPAHYNTTGKPLPLVSFGRYADGSRYALFITQQNVAMFQEIVDGQSAAQIYGNSTIMPADVYHVVGTADGQTIRLYVNGELEGSKPYSGSPRYNPSNPYGLFIGGAPTSDDPSFNGTIAQVAVYHGALSAPQVLRHYETGQLSPMITQTPMSSDGFVDSIGINTHFADYNSLYGTSYSQARSALTSLGIRHIRDGLVAPGHPIQLSQFADLGSAGVRGLFVTQLSTTQAMIESYPSQVGNMLEAYEPPNEQDDVGNANWVADLKAYQKNIYSWVKNGSATHQYPVLGPALVGEPSYPKVGDISAYLDNANVHDYMNPYNPGTSGWGSITPYGRYGSISYNLNLVKVTSENKPVVATETGWGTNVTGTVDNYALLRYIPRLFFEQVNSGIVRTYSYELLDDGGNGNDLFETFGLVQHDFTPKPAYTALKGIIAELRDPGGSFTTTPLTYQLVGNTNGVVHTLMQRRNGSYQLAVWIETPSYWISSGAGSDLIVPAQSVTLNTTSAFSSATISSLNENGDLTTTPLSWSKTTATFNVTDKVSIITINP